ncbi:DUF6879 family protein [Lentzea sp. NPDC055074]
MHDLIDNDRGVRLLGDEYFNHFDERFWRIGPTGFWKLERLQHFEEPSDESWVAFDAGDWRRSIALLDERRSALRAHYDRIAASGFTTWRVRVVERPLTEYLQWELHLLRLRDELGGHTRVLPADQVQRFETNRLLPELITLGDDVMYEILYDERGLLEGAILHTGREIVGQCREFVRFLYGQGEPIGTYFEREVATLRPPLRNT